MSLTSKISSMYEKHNYSRACQGDILRDLVYVEWAYQESGKITISDREIPYLVILTQDCDLEQDFTNHNSSPADGFNHDKFLQSILVCPAYLAEELRVGDQLSEIGMKMEPINSERWSLVKKNQTPRYHFLKGQTEYQVPELVIDFKHYYTIPRPILYSKLKDNYLATLNSLFRESLSQRFAYYLSRIGLPTIKQEPPSE